LRNCEVYHDLYVKWGMGHILGGYVCKDESIGAVLALHRPLGMREYDEEDIRLSGLIVPHLKRAIRLQWLLSHAEGIGAATAGALSSVAVGTIIADRSGRVIEMNAAARASMAAGAPLRVRAGLLDAKSPRINEWLQREIAAAAGARGARVAGEDNLVNLSDESGRSWIIAVAPVRGTQWATIFLIEPDRIPATTDQQLRRLFGLTPSEAKVAVALCRGLPLAAISHQTATTVETVRTHLKRILAKTGAHTQAEVVSIILRSVRIDLAADL
jgi:DNA-binding CsgD family transcriptional regulator